MKKYRNEISTEITTGNLTSTRENRNDLLLQEAQWSEIVSIVAAKVRDQEFIKGNNAVTYYSAMTIGLAFVICLILHPEMFLSLTTAMLPAPVLLGIMICSSRDRTMSSALVFEFLWLGGILSIVMGFMMEVVALTLSHSVQVCNLSDAHPTIPCDFFFLLTMILAVGASEEIAKLLPVSRVAIRREAIVHQVRWWFRYIDNPAHLVIVAAASGLGFATIENLKYIFVIAPDTSSFGMAKVALLRGILSVPLHWACTASAGAIIALTCFKMTPAGTLKVGGITSRHLLQALAFPTIMHGLYDGFLMLAAKVPPQFVDPAHTIAENIQPMVVPVRRVMYSLRHTMTNFPALETNWNPNHMFDDPYEGYATIWTATCAAIGFCSYATTLIVFGTLWKKVLILEEKAFRGILEDRRDCPLRPLTDYAPAYRIDRPLIASSETA